MANNLTFISKLLYRLKRRYGIRVDVYKLLSTDTDILSGVTTNIVRRYTIKRGVLMPSTFQRDFVYDIAYVTAASNFSYGGLFDQGVRRLIIDRKEDLPEGVGIDLDDYCIIKGRRYNMRRVSEFEDDQAYVFMLKEVTGQDISTAIAIETITDNLTITEQITLNGEYPRTVADNLTITEQIILSGEYSRTVADTLTVTEQIVNFVERLGVSLDSLTFTDQNSTTADRTGTVTDNLSPSENIIAALGAPPSETVTVSGTLTPDATGVYTKIGSNYYLNGDQSASSFALWEETGFGLGWLISTADQANDSFANPLWGYNISGPLGTYNPLGYIGVATVT